MSLSSFYSWALGRQKQQNNIDTDNEHSVKQLEETMKTESFLGGLSVENFMFLLSYPEERKKLMLV